MIFQLGFLGFLLTTLYKIYSIDSDAIRSENDFKIYEYSQKNLNNLNDNKPENLDDKKPENLNISSEFSYFGRKDEYRVLLMFLKDNCETFMCDKDFIRLKNSIYFCSKEKKTKLWNFIQGVYGIKYAHFEIYKKIRQNRNFIDEEIAMQIYDSIEDYKVLQIEFTELKKEYIKKELDNTNPILFDISDYDLEIYIAMKNLHDAFDEIEFLENLEFIIFISGPKISDREDYFNDLIIRIYSCNFMYTRLFIDIGSKNFIDSKQITEEITHCIKKYEILKEKIYFFKENSIHFNQNIIPAEKIYKIDKKLAKYDLFFVLRELYDDMVYLNYMNQEEHNITLKNTNLQFSCLELEYCQIYQKIRMHNGFYDKEIKKKIKELIDKFNFLKRKFYDLSFYSISPPL